jgi:hypothetical protein
MNKTPPIQLSHKTGILAALEGLLQNRVDKHLGSTMTNDLLSGNHAPMSSLPFAIMVSMSLTGLGSWSFMFTVDGLVLLPWRIAERIDAVSSVVPGLVQLSHRRIPCKDFHLLVKQVQTATLKSGASAMKPGTSSFLSFLDLFAKSRGMLLLPIAVAGRQLPRIELALAAEGEVRTMISDCHQIVVRAIEIDLTSTARWTALRTKRQPSDHVSGMQSCLAWDSDVGMPMKDQEKEGGDNKEVKTTGQETPSPQTSTLTKEQPHMAEVVGFSDWKARKKHKGCW